MLFTALDRIKQKSRRVKHYLLLLESTAKKFLVQIYIKPPLVQKMYTDLSYQRRWLNINITHKCQNVHNFVDRELKLLNCSKYLSLISTLRNWSCIPTVTAVCQKLWNRLVHKPPSRPINHMVIPIWPPPTPVLYQTFKCCLPRYKNLKVNVKWKCFLTLSVYVSLPVCISISGAINGGVPPKPCASPDGYTNLLIP